jgi:hypothetical protein
LLQKRQAINSAAEETLTDNINLANLEINDNDLPFLREVLEKSNPHRIDLSNNQLTRSCRSKLIDLLGACSFLVKVNLTSNSLDHDVMAAVNNEISPSSRMEKLLKAYQSFEYGNSQSSLIRHLRANDAVVLKIEEEGWTLFHFAARHGNSDLFYLACDEDLLKLTNDEEKMNTLHLALNAGHEDLWVV